MKAETLAGKGLFNTETTKVLHLQQNPFMQAICDKYKKEISTLNAEIKNLKAGISSKGSSSTLTPKSDVDAQKLHTRLKENFQEQIWMFREAVYLITGFKIDMISSEPPEMPSFKVRFMYAGRENDYLMFKWPDVKRSTTIKMLDLLSTEFANELAETEEFQYVTKFNSIPGFLASLTMRLFEDSTIT